MSTEKLNRNHKSSVFSSYFSENTARMVELYNAIENANYPLDTPVVENTLEDALYKDKLNDLSFVLDGQILVLIEHQSTINNNMALRLLMYAGRLYEKIMNENGALKEAIYYGKPLPIPTPKFVVLYNGEADIPEYSVQKLSDMFMTEQENPALELNVQVYNINYGKSEELMKKSSSIQEYARFIHQINENRKAGMDNETAAKQAIRECISANIMAEYLLKNGSEVENMLYFEWSQEEAEEYAEKRGRAEGVVYGEKKKQEEMIRAFQDVLSPEVIAEKIHVPVQYVLDILKDDGAAMVCEPTQSYHNDKKE